MNTPVKSHSKSPFTKHNRGDDTTSSKASLNISILSEYITTGFKSLNDALKKLKCLKKELQEHTEGQRGQSKWIVALKDIYTHLKLGERSMYLVFESGMLQWVDSEKNSASK